MPAVVLFQPQIPPNTGNIGRTCAATATPLHLIEPLGFSLEDRHLKRAGLDYWPLLELHRHGSWDSFAAERQRRGGRLIALSSHARQPYSTCRFRPDDWLLFGRETDGLPEAVHAAADLRLLIPIREGVRSLNLSVSVGVVLFEALRQISGSDAADPLRCSGSHQL